MRSAPQRGSGPDVLMVTNMWPHDGNPAFGIFVARQVESVRALGLDCDVLTIEGYRSRWAYARCALQLLRLNFASRRPRLVHAHGGETALAARFYVRGPVIVSYCGDDLLGTPRADGSITRSSRLRRFVLRNHARTLTATITKSFEMETTLPRSVRRRNSVVPNGVDRTVFRPLPRDAARRQLGWAQDERVALFAADRAVERKRHWLAEAACKEAERVLGPVRLKIAWGTSPDEMPALMAASDCLLLTSAIEGSPNVVKEAVTTGLPVIATPVGDVAEVLAQVTPSWVCPPDPVALGAALVSCFSSLRRSNGWDQARWLDQKAIASRLRDIYRSHAALEPAGSS